MIISRNPASVDHTEARNEIVSNYATPSAFRNSVQPIVRKSSRNSSVHEFSGSKLVSSRGPNPLVLPVTETRLPGVTARRPAPPSGDIGPTRSPASPFRESLTP